MGSVRDRFCYNFLHFCVAGESLQDKLEKKLLGKLKQYQFIWEVTNDLFVHPCNQLCVTLHNCNLPIVSLPAVSRLVTQRSSPGEERYVTILKTAARETNLLMNHHMI